jgi:mono/diheme cytochrome c family protein
MERQVTFVKMVLFSAAVFCLLGAANPNSPIDALENTAKPIPSMKQIPTEEMLESGKSNYQSFCAVCHGDQGQGKTGPAIKGNKVATGRLKKHIDIVLGGHHMRSMPSWGLTELSDEAIAEIITFQRNSWGNNDVKKFGKFAGGIVTPDMVKKRRANLKQKPRKENIRT